MTDETTAFAHGSEQFKPNTTVAAIVYCQDKFLLVEEEEHGKRVFNQPAGHIEAKESIAQGAIRELTEETGLLLQPSYLSGIYYFHRPDLHLYFLRFCFVFTIENIITTQPQDDEIIATHWLTYEEILEKKEHLRSSMVLECIEDYLAGQKIELSALKSNL